MFDMLKNLFQNRIDKNKIAELIGSSPEALEAFDRAYFQNALGESDGTIFGTTPKQARESALQPTAETADPEQLDRLIDRIADELVEQTTVWRCDGRSAEFTDKSQQPKLIGAPVTADEIKQLPLQLRPQLTGQLISLDCPGRSYETLLDGYIRYLKASDPKAKKSHYGRFRQGLDILDLDPVLYAMLGKNPNSIGFWLPKIVHAVEQGRFFRIPATTVIKVPITLLQLTRKDYPTLTETSLKIADRFCQKIFRLDDTRDYFIKTGTFSSKFDFRNAHITAGDEVHDIGQYLLYIQHQAVMMAGYDLSGRDQPVIYGVSTTNEWCVREFIKDKDGNPTIYNGLPLHTEYRVFVDFDAKQVLAIHPYWDRKTMNDRFDKGGDAELARNVHDSIAFKACQDRLDACYEANKDKVAQHIQEILPDIPMHGQWSVDVMQNGDDFWIIDMATAETSAFYDCVPEELRLPQPENWLPDYVELPKEIK